MESCPHCDRTFVKGRLQAHLKSCKPDNPMKKLVQKNTPRQETIKKQCSVVQEVDESLTIADFTEEKGPKELKNRSARSHKIDPSVTQT
jgi:hypothetical protein